MEARTDHRPWPLPERPWVMAMAWHDLLFAHWPVPVATIAETLPPGLVPDTFPDPVSGDECAWLAVVPFRMSGVRLRGLPALPGSGAFPELNLRTYVRPGGTPGAGVDRPGVWFYSLDAASRLAVASARAWFHLPYVHAQLDCVEIEPLGTPGGGGGEGGVRPERDPGVEYTSRRAADPRPEVVVRYGPTGAPFTAQPGTLEHWLTERYCLYAHRPASAVRRGAILRGEIHHAPWPLQPAVADFGRNELAAASGFQLPDREPHLLFARRLDVVAFAPRPLP